MKKITVVVSAILVLFLFFAVFSVHSETVKKINFKKVLEFSDSSEDFYFKYPDNPYKRQIRVDAEGYIYILDADRILKFSSSGKFIKNLVSGGQGPGEVTNLRNFFLHRDKIVIYNIYPDKIILKDKNALLIKEFRIKKSLDKFFAVYDKNYYFFDPELPELKGENAKTIDIDNHLIKVSAKGKIEKIKDYSIPIKTFIAVRGGRGEIRIGKLLATRFKDNYFFVTNSTEYEVNLLDIDKKAIVKTFKREYERQETPAEMAKKLNRQFFQLMDRRYHRPPQKYMNDIQQLLVYKDNLWVVTSTVDKKQGVLVDIYNARCEYTGSFFLKLSDRVSYPDYLSFNAYIFDKFLYKIERDEEDNPWLVKYKIIVE